MDIPLKFDLTIDNPKKYFVWQLRRELMKRHPTIDFIKCTASYADEVFFLSNPETQFDVLADYGIRADYGSRESHTVDPSRSSTVLVIVPPVHPVQTRLEGDVEAEADESTRTEMDSG